MTASILTTGVDARYYVKAESAFDEVIAIGSTAVIAADAVALTELEVTPDREFHKSKEHRGTASLQNEIASKYKGKWKAKAYVVPEAAGTPPDIGPFLKAAFGTETPDAGVKVTYSLNASQPTSFKVVRHCGNGLYDVMTGMWVEEVEIDLTGNAEPVIILSGGFARYGFAMPATVAAHSYATGVATVGLTTASNGRVHRGAVVKFGTDDNSGLGYVVTSRDLSAATITFAPVLAGAGLSGGEAVLPVSPTPAYGSGTILGGVDGSLTRDGNEMGLITGKTVLKTGFHGLDKEHTTSRVNRVSRGMREVTLDLSCYLLDDENAALVGGSWDGTLHAFIQRAGPSSAGHMKIITGNVRLDVPAVKLPEAEETIIEFKGTAREVSAAEDEISLEFA